MAVTVQFASWNADRLLRRLPARVLDDFGTRISAQLQQEISKEQFDWPNWTYRKSGAVVPPSPRYAPGGKLRDIVDTGALLDSQQAPVVTAEDNKVVMRIEWSAPYSGAVLHGGYMVGNSVKNQIAPSRDWITPALKAQDPAAFFAARWKELS